MTFTVFACAFECFTGVRSKTLGLQAASRHRPIAFAPEGSSLDRCLPVNNPGYRAR